MFSCHLFACQYFVQTVVFLHEYFHSQWKWIIHSEKSDMIFFSSQSVKAFVLRIKAPTDHAVGNRRHVTTHENVDLLIVCLSWSLILSWWTENYKKKKKTQVNSVASCIENPPIILPRRTWGCGSNAASLNLTVWPQRLTDSPSDPFKLKSAP